MGAGYWEKYHISYELAQALRPLEGIFIIGQHAEPQKVIQD